MTGRLARVPAVSTLLCLAATLAAATASSVTTSAFDIANSEGLGAATRLSPPPRTFSLVATGDVLTESVVNFAAAQFAQGTGIRYDFAPLFAPISPMIASADIAICHMELPIGRPGDRAGVYGDTPSGHHRLLAPYEIAIAMKRVGFDQCSTASNHSNDLDTPGIDTTLAALDTAGLSHVGTARTPAEAVASLLTVNGVRLAHLSYTRWSNSPLPAEPWRVNFATSPAQVAADVTAARGAGADVVVVSVHISEELLPAPLPEDRQFIVDLTALTRIDLIIEHGPHVVQPVEEINGTWVYWSVGNLISGMGTPGRKRYDDPRTLDGLAATARFTETSSGVFDVEPWTVLVCNEPSTRVVYAPIGGSTDALPPIVHFGLQACIARASSVVRELH